jgi:hypothetical protein
VNIVNPGVDTATFPAGITHDANGWTPDGATQYGDFDFNPNNQSAEAAKIGDARFLKNTACIFARVGTIGAGTALYGSETIGSRNTMTLANSNAQRLNSNSATLPSAKDMTGSNKFKAAVRRGTDITMDNDGVRNTYTIGTPALTNDKIQLWRNGATISGTAVVEAFGIGSIMEDDDLDALRTDLAILTA